MLDTSVRLLRLLSLLQARRLWSGAELASRLEVSTRTVRNDVERLRILGYQVDSTTGTAGGYRLGSGSELPPLLLDDDEAVAVAFALSAAASGTVTGIEEMSERALAKLEQTLPSRLRHRIDTLRSATVSAAGGGGPTVDADILTVIADACHRHERLRFDYDDRNGNGSLRQVEPHRLVYTGHRWYLLAWDLDKDDWRTFRADRVHPRIPTGPRFTPREPVEDATSHVLRGVGSGAWRYQARIRFLMPASTVAAQITPPTGLLTPIDDHTCILETGANSLHDLAVYFGRIDLPFTIDEPPELLDLVRTLAARLTAVAEG